MPTTRLGRSPSRGLSSPSRPCEDFALGTSRARPWLACAESVMGVVANRAWARAAMSGFLAVESEARSPCGLPRSPCVCCQHVWAPFAPCLGARRGFLTRGGCRWAVLCCATNWRGRELVRTAGSNGTVCSVSKARRCCSSWRWQKGCPFASQTQIVIGALHGTR